MPETPPATMTLRRTDSRTALSIERLAREKEPFEQGVDSDDEVLPDGWEATRNREEQEYAGRLAKTTSRLAVWSGNTVWWAVRNPLILRLEAGLEAYDQRGEPSSRSVEERTELLAILSSISGQEAKA